MSVDIVFVVVINWFCQDCNVVILVYYYQELEIQDIVDFVGDFLELLCKVVSIDVDVIVFCGVYFMVEIVKIFSLEKIVVLLDLEVGCFLVDDCFVDEFVCFWVEYFDYFVVSYINCMVVVKV